MPFEDVAAEAVVIAGVLQHGQDAFVDIDGLVEPDMLGDDLNRYILTLVKDHFGAGESAPIDFARLMSLANKHGLASYFDDDEAKKYVRSLYRFTVSKETVLPEAAKIRKLYKAQELFDIIKQSGKQLQKITGDETLTEILSIIEGPLTEFSIGLDGAGSEGPVQIAQDGKEWLENILANPCDNMGIPSPYPKWNDQIGGGFRTGTVSLLAARSKQGKSHFADNVALYIAGTLGIPVLNIDTEMSAGQHLARILANLTNIDSKKIEKGQVTEEEAELLRDKMEWLTSIPYYYESVINKSFPEQIASIRRWHLKTIQADDNGVKPHSLVIYDYLQVFGESELNSHTNESQKLGHMMMSLLQLADKLSTAILSLIQLNRSGTVFGSDRPAMKCASLTILRRKEEAELADDGTENGSHMLETKLSRFGDGGDGNYISLRVNLATSTISEGMTNRELRKVRGPRKASNEDTFEVPRRKLKKPKVVQLAEPDDTVF